MKLKMIYNEIEKGTNKMRYEDILQIPVCLDLCHNFYLNYMVGLSQLNLQYHFLICEVLQ